jgi:hypothetical protein
VAVACAIAMAGCGSGAKPSSSASDGDTAGIKLAQCMRAQGVPSFPDPGSTGGAFGQQIVRSGIDPQSPAFQSAMSACQKLAPAGKAAFGPSSETRKVKLVKLAECMRARGLRMFPDPTTSASSAPASGVIIASSGPGGSVSLSVPQTMIQSPSFKQAATACGFPVPGAAKHAAAG